MASFNGKNLKCARGNHIDSGSLAALGATNPRTGSPKPFGFWSKIGRNEPDMTGIIERDQIANRPGPGTAIGETWTTQMPAGSQEPGRYLQTPRGSDG